MHAHDFHYHLPRLTEMRRVFWGHALSSIGVTLVAVFVPIFLLKQGYAFPEVVLFLLMHQLFAALLQFPVGKLVGRIGPNKGMALGMLAAIAFFSMLLTLPAIGWPLVLMALVRAVDRTAYWLSFHANFSKARAHEKAGRQISSINSVMMLASGITPAIGGIIATGVGIGWTYAAGIAFLLAASVPFWRAPDVVEPETATVRELNLRRIWKDPVANGFNGMTTGAEIIVWPLIIYFVVESYAAVGILSSIILIASVGVSLYVGRREEQRGERHYLKQGLGLESLTNVLRAVVQNAFHVFGVNLIGGVGRSLYLTPYMTRYYRNADGPHRISYIAAMETAHEAGFAAILSGLYLLSLALAPEQALLWTALLAAPASFGTRLIR